ncbi:hypothetical protein A2348_03915 [Candidatus Uhrbacteria bacterium RIFOXYB12_FULL_58_10]|uniref:Uncharacterized protein n=1 Tax=Candidatus Uhrbacteria bacterium RIFOXYB2_FULL_57_15 TaxID=1802422 RepID=A0A1F7W8I6_9BACT|nr:MAG: hypothetical protein A2348_03915 [Candidatus Uhrbacteria bacterium RIFOXYB12_FULL_58_10]OGL99111.1 MAG: hypothetical protein A2304_04580 [Candidatus Uhrbacteria bacterium RIFOXYB2_FULL_57_15]
MSEIKKFNVDIEHIHLIEEDGGEFGFCACGARAQLRALKNNSWQDIERLIWVDKEKLAKEQKEEKDKEARKKVIEMRGRKLGIEIFINDESGATVIREITWEEGGRQEATREYERLLATGLYKQPNRPPPSSRMFAEYDD